MQPANHHNMTTVEIVVVVQGRRGQSGLQVYEIVVVVQGRKKREGV